MAFFVLVNTGHFVEKWALLVGINNYQYDVSPLGYYVADVKAFRQALVNVVGFKIKIVNSDIDVAVCEILQS